MDKISYFIERTLNSGKKSEFYRELKSFIERVKNNEIIDLLKIIDTH